MGYCSIRFGRKYLSLYNDDMIGSSKNKKNNNHKKKMTKYLESIIKSVNLESNLDKSPVFKNSKDAMKWLKSIKIK